MPKKDIIPKFGQDIPQLVEELKVKLTQKVAPVGVEPEVVENSRRIALTKGDWVIEIPIGN